MPRLEYYPLVAEHNYLPYVAGIDPEVADRAKYMIVSLPANRWLGGHTRGLRGDYRFRPRA